MMNKGEYPRRKQGGNLRDLNIILQDMQENGNIAGIITMLSPGYALPARRKASFALYSLATQDDVPAISEALKSTEDKAIALNLIQTLGRIGTDEALPVLIQCLKNRDAQVRMETAEAISRFNSEAAFQALLAALKQKGDEQDRFVRQYAAEGLGKLGDRRAYDALIIALNDPSELVRPAAATALGKLGDRRAVPMLQRVRHTAPHPKGADCAECKAIDGALEALKPLKD